MLGFALFASCRPCHDDWLKQRSSPPPVSSTMQAVTGPPAAAVLAGALAEVGGALVLDVALLDDAVVVGLELLELDGLLLHAVMASATIPLAAMALTIFFTTTPPAS